MSDGGGERGTSASNGGTDAPDERCANCGQAIDTGEWYPVTTRRDDDGSLQFFPFCSESCQDAWLAEHDE